MKEPKIDPVVVEFNKLREMMSEFDYKLSLFKKGSKFMSSLHIKPIQESKTNIPLENIKFSTVEDITRDIINRENTDEDYMNLLLETKDISTIQNEEEHRPNKFRNKTSKKLRRYNNTPKSILS